MLAHSVFDEVYTLVCVALSEMTQTNEESGEEELKWETLSFSRSTRFDDEPIMPCLVCRQIGARQIGNTLEDRAENAINSTFQIECNSNISYDEAFTLMEDVTIIMQQLGFSKVMEIEDSTQTVWRFVGRFSRVIGANELPLKLG